MARSDGDGFERCKQFHFYIESVRVSRNVGTADGSASPFGRDVPRATRPRPAAVSQARSTRTKRRSSCLPISGLSRISTRASIDNRRGLPSRAISPRASDQPNASRPSESLDSSASLASSLPRRHAPRGSRTRAVPRRVCPRRRLARRGGVPGERPGGCDGEAASQETRPEAARGKKRGRRVPRPVSQSRRDQRAAANAARS